MKTLGWIMTAALGLGIATATPAMAREEHGRPEARAETVRVDRNIRTDRTVEVRHDVIRDDVIRHDTIIRDRPIIVNHDRFIDRPVIVEQPYFAVPAPLIVADCNVPVAIPNLPVCVTDTITLAGRGPVDSVQFVTSNGAQFYDVVVGRGGVHFDMHVGIDGALLSLGGC